MRKMRIKLSENETLKEGLFKYTIFIICVAASTLLLLVALLVSKQDLIRFSTTGTLPAIIAIFVYIVLTLAVIVSAIITVRKTINIIKLIRRETAELVEENFGK